MYKSLAVQIICVSLYCIHLLIKNKVMKKIVIISVILSLTALGGYFGYKEYQKQEEVKKYNQTIENFKSNLCDINEVSPDHMYLFTIETLSEQKKDPNSPFSKWTTEMIHDQAAYSFRSESEDLIKVVIKMLSYKKIITSNGVSIKELQSFVDRVRNNKSDKIDIMIVDSFDLAVEYQQRYLELNSNYF